MTSVMPVSTNAAVRQPQASDASKANLDYSAFLRLFIASMKNQDPTKPNDPSQTMAQLASFSNVEQSIKLNDKLNALLSSTNAGVAAALIGKTVSSLDGKVSGTVVSVDNTPGGLVAALEGGEFLNLAEGYRIKAS
jgi:flagellar basal-body rod modification protein FlgD